MPLYDDLLVDGDSLSELLDTGICIEGPWEWPYLSADQRGDLPVYLGYDGVGYADQPYNPYLLPLYITLDAPACEGGTETEQSDETWAWLNQAMMTLQAFCKPDQLVTLTRQKSMPGAVELDQECRAKLARITPARPGRDTLKLVVEFTQLDGIWYGPEESFTLLDGVPAVHDILGTTRTNDIRVTHGNDGTAFTVTNQSNSYAFDFDPPASSGSTILVPERRAYATASPTTDRSRYLSWTKQQVWRLDPGDQTLLADGQNVTVYYRPAYL